MFSFLEEQIMHILLGLLVAFFVASIAFYLFSYKPLEAELKRVKHTLEMTKEELFLTVNRCDETTFETKYNDKIPTNEEHNNEENDTSISFFGNFPDSGV